jgi:hypothetical protein
VRGPVAKMKGTGWQTCLSDVVLESFQCGTVGGIGDIGGGNGTSAIPYAGTMSLCARQSACPEAGAGSRDRMSIHRCGVQLHCRIEA